VVGVRVGLEMDVEGLTRRPGSGFQGRKGNGNSPGMLTRVSLEAEFRFVEDIEGVKLLSRENCRVVGLRPRRASGCKWRRRMKSLRYCMQSQRPGVFMAKRLVTLVQEPFVLLV
jgi:hypothetical protein